MTTWTWHLTTQRSVAIPLQNNSRASRLLIITRWHLQILSKIQRHSADSDIYVTSSRPIYFFSYQTRSVRRTQDTRLHSFLISASLANRRYFLLTVGDSCQSFCRKQQRLQRRANTQLLPHNDTWGDTLPRICETTTSTSITSSNGNSADVAPNPQPSCVAAMKIWTHVRSDTPSPSAWLQETGSAD